MLSHIPTARGAEAAPPVGDFPTTAYDLPGTVSDRIQVATNTGWSDILNGTSQLTVSAWFLADTLNPGTVSNFIVQHWIDNSNYAFQLNVNQNGSVEFSGRPQAGDSWSGTSSETDLVRINEQYHIVGTLDYAAKRIYVWLGGTQVINFGASGWSSSTLFMSSGYRGGYGCHGAYAGFSDRFLNGYVVQCGFWRRELTQNEINTLAAGAKPETIPDAVMQHTLDPNGDEFADSIGTGNMEGLGTVNATNTRPTTPP